MNDMTDAEFFEALNNIKYELPEWMKGTIESQIEYQVKLARENNPEWKHFLAFTYDANREPRVQKQVVELV
ncbi:hypothetical protein [Yersinia phage MHG19]|nr:hypothetical protein [Yersinia phage MHG19]